MSESTIKVEGISKRYRIGTAVDPNDSMLGSFIKLATSPVRNLKQLRRLSKFGDDEGEDDIIWALRDVSFEVDEGEVVGVVGSNGAGKSTLLKVMSRITEPTEGQISIRGRVASLLEVGTAFHPDLSGRDNVFLNGTVLGMTRSEIRDQFDEIVEFADISRFIDTQVKKYSDGMRLRLGFAIAAHLRPEILLVDEVLAVGDAAFQRKCMSKIAGISQEGRTILFVSHNMAALQNMCSRGVYLKDGQVAATGSIADVISEYLDLTDEPVEGTKSWSTPESAPGDYRARLKSVRVIGDGQPTQELDFEKSFKIELDFWNMEPGKRTISFHIKDSKNQLVLTSGNVPTATVTLDPWYDKSYPEGIFRTTCEIPGHLLNSGRYYLTVIMNGPFLKDKIARETDVLSFALTDPHIMEREFTGEWLGILRTKLDWNTMQVG